MSSSLISWRCDDTDEVVKRWLCGDEDDGVSYAVVKPKTNTRPVMTAPKYSVPYIKEVIFNEEGKATIVIWDDSSKTVVHCGEGERYDRYTGFMACICKKMFGGTTPAKKLMNKLDRKYQAKLKEEAEEKEKAKRIAEAEEAKAKAMKLREKRNADLLEEMVEYFLMEAEAKKIADDIIASEENPEEEKKEDNE